MSVLLLHRLAISASDCDKQAVSLIALLFGVKLLNLCSSAKEKTALNSCKTCEIVYLVVIPYKTV